MISIIELLVIVWSIFRTMSRNIYINAMLEEFRVLYVALTRARERLIVTGKLRKKTEDFIEEYINSSEPYDKAGGYAIQGKAAPVISKINGCYFSVVGLPVNCLCKLAAENGIPFTFNK